MNPPITDIPKNRKTIDEKATLLNWLQRFGSRFQTGLIVTDPAGDDDPIVFVNQAFTDITGYSLEEAYGENCRIMHGEDTDIALIKEIDRQLHEGIPVNEEILNYKKDGTPFWNELVIQPLVNGIGEVLFTASFILDVTGRKKDESLLRLQEKIFVGINEGAELSVLLQKICDVVESFFPTESVCSILFRDEKKGWYVGAAESVPGPLVQQFLHNATQVEDQIPEDLMIVEDIKYCPRWATQLGDSSSLDYHASWAVPTKDGEGNLNGVFIVCLKKPGAPTETQMQFLEKLPPLIQLAKSYYEQQAQYRRLAFTDPETGLPNRHAFLRKLNNDIKNGRNQFVAVIAPSEYSRIVDLFGRGAADELFFQLGKRIENVGKGKPNFVGRFSTGSLVLTNDLSTNDEGDYQILELRKIVSEPFVVAGQEMFITLKIGIALNAEDATSGEELLRRADFALTDAKKIPGNGMAYYKDLQNEMTIKEMSLFNELSKALVANELDVFLQPKVNLETSEIVGFEALARWFSPVLGQVPPNVFIPAAENMGRIIELEIGVLSKVMEWQQKRANSGKKVYQVAANISVDHFFHESFIEMLKGLVSKYNVSPKYVRLELTESIGLVDFASAKEIFNNLNALGFETSIDDFGVGFSSLSYLPQLPVSELKIDRSFIRALEEPDTRAVVTTIIQLANNLKLSTVAEGIEEQVHIDILKSLGCKVGQGFFYYKPMPLSEINLVLDKE